MQQLWNVQKVPPLLHGSEAKCSCTAELVELCRQAVMPAALALALLYLTVLSFGLLATAYLKWRGMSEAELSIFRGLGALAGVSVTFLFPRIYPRLGARP